MKLADRLGRTFAVHTVGELTEKLLHESYVDVRRHKSTINKHEIQKIVVETFSKDFGIEKIHLTNEAKFSWSK